MTGDIFDALELRFNGFESLVTVGRKLFQGFDQDRLVNVVRPYTEVNIDKTPTRLNTWDSDIDEWDVKFHYHAKDLRPNAANAWTRAMRQAFKDGDLTNGVFRCCGVSEMAIMAPRNATSAFDAAVRFVMTVEWRELTPSVRGN